MSERQRRQLRIDGVEIHDGGDCYVVAEIGHNHQGELDKAKQLIEAAKECGVNAVKLQKRSNRTLFTREFFDQPYDNEFSFGRTYGEHREALELGREEWIELQRYARELDITLFGTAFDFESADLLAELDVPVFKLASADLQNTPLLRHVAAFGKPMLLSTGGAVIEDVQRAVDAILPLNDRLCILQCTAAYPCTSRSTTPGRARTMPSRSCRKECASSYGTCAASRPRSATASSVLCRSRSGRC